MSYRTVIGLEVHVQLLTQTKLFCGCSTKFGLPPNSATCPICTGMPGTLPVMNATAFRLALKAALALNCTIAPFTKWDRKNYFYPDLPKNYQISQYDLPFSSNGWLDIETDASGRTTSKRVGILRAHLEEDAGKMLHDESGRRRDSRVDLNRTGTPLLEIVSQPEMETAEEAKAYLETIRELLRGIEVSDCEMQEGSLRCDANVNLHVPMPDGRTVATPIIEIKNLNSIRGVERAIKHEVDRQHAELLENLGGKWFLEPNQTKTFLGETLAVVLQRSQDGRAIPVSKATAGWDDVRGKTEVQRRKEEAADYRYFPDPDLAPVTVSPAEIEAARQGLGETPAAQRTRLASQYGLSEYDANGLTQKGRRMVAYFETVAKIGGDAKEACNWILNELAQTMNEHGDEYPLTAERLGGLILEAKKGHNKQQARKIYAEMIASDVDAETAVATLGLKVMGDANELREIVRRAIAGNAKAVADYKKGKVKAADAIKGAVMRETKGAAKMEQVQAILIEELNAIP